MLTDSRLRANLRHVIAIEYEDYSVCSLILNELFYLPYEVKYEHLDLSEITGGQIDDIEAVTVIYGGTD